MKTKLVPPLLEPAQHGEQALDSGGESAEVGSSRMMIRAPENSTRPSSTSCCRPSGKAPASARVDVDAEPLQMLARLARPWRASDGAEPADRLHAEEDILGDRQVRRDAQLLMHHADAGRQRVAGGAEATGAPSQAHDPAIVGVHAGDDLHQRALAGAVLADETMDLAGGQREVDAVQRQHAAEGLADALELEDGRPLPPRDAVVARRSDQPER